MKEVQIQYEAVVYVHEKSEHVNIPKMESAAAGVNLYQKQATNGKIVIADAFSTEDLREKWEKSLLKLSPQPRNFFATGLKIHGENRRTLSAQAKKALDNCRGRFIGEIDKKGTLFLIVGFDNPDLRRFWEGTVEVLKS